MSVILPDDAWVDVEWVGARVVDESTTVSASKPNLLPNRNMHPTPSSPLHTLPPADQARTRKLTKKWFVTN